MQGKLSQKVYLQRLQYLVARVPAGCLEFAIHLADNDLYCSIRVRTDQRGDLLFEGLLDGGLYWSSDAFVEGFYLRRERPWVDPLPIQTVWGTF